MEVGLKTLEKEGERAKKKQLTSNEEEGVRFFVLFYGDKPKVREDGKTKLSLIFPRERNCKTIDE